MSLGSLPSGRERMLRASVDQVSPPVELHTIRLQPRGRPQQDAMTIRLASNDGERSRANMLLKRKYSWRGYETQFALPSTPNCITFTAAADEDLIGTLTLTIDSAGGLACDRTFKDELDKFRGAPGASLCELTKFAFDTSLPARPRLAALFHMIFIYGSMHHDCTDLFIEVNPRHSRFYEAMLGFTPVGLPRLNTEVNAPAQLMWLNVGDLRRLINRFAGDASSSGRTLYANFFSPEEEQGIRGRLARAAAGGQKPANDEVTPALDRKPLKNAQLARAC